MAITRDDILAYARRLTGGGVNDDDEARRIEAVNQAIEKLPKLYAFSQYSEFERLNLKPVEATGTVSIAGDRKTITGTSAVFTADMVDQVIQIAGDTMFHRIASFTNSTTIVLADQYQTLDSTTFAAGSKYEIFFYSYDLPVRTQNVEEVVLLDGGPKLRERKHMWIQRELATSVGIGSSQPRNWSLVSSVDTDKTTKHRMILYPPPNRNHIIGYIRQRKPASLPVLGTDELDVPPTLEGLFKAIVADRLGIVDKRWSNAARVGKVDLAIELEDAKSSDNDQAAPFQIGEERTNNDLIQSNVFVITEDV